VRCNDVGIYTDGYFDHKVLYETGWGVPQDKVLALALYNVSVAYAGSGKTQAAQNRQGLANRMPLDEVKKTQLLTEELFKPGNLKSGLQSYLGY